MPINFFPNDPLVSNPGLRKQNPRPDRPPRRAGLTFTFTADEDTYDPDTDLRDFLFWQGRESVLDAVETWEGLFGNLGQWSEEADDPKKLELDLDHDDPQFTGPNKLNAFYDRVGLRFFIFDDGTTKWASGLSTDTVSHETGHALLDTLRPDLWGSMKPEVPAFHESFADCWALLTALADPASRTQVLQDSPDLRGENFVEANSEYLSSAIRKTFGKVAASEPRHALNQLQWQLPTTLPAGSFRDPPSTLSREPHSFSRVFTGCFYDTITGIFAALPAHNPDTLLQAAQTAAQLLIAALRAVPQSSRFFRDVGRGMVLADQQQNGGGHQEILTEAFGNHGLTLGAAALLAPDAALDGPAPSIIRDKVKLAAQTVKDLRARIRAVAGSKLLLGVRNIAGRKVAEAMHLREVPLDALDKRLKGVVAVAAEPLLVGSSGARAAVLGTLPEPNKTEDEVHAFVEMLLRHGRILFAPKKGAKRAGRATAAPSDAGMAVPTHVIRSRGTKKILERVRFLCGCPGRGAAAHH
jgi:hypothetical protein